MTNPYAFTWKGFFVLARKVFFISILLLLVSAAVFSLETSPYRIKEFDVNLTQSAKVAVSGEISKNDELEIEFLAFKKNESQRIISEEAILESGGGKTIKGTFEDKNGNRAAVFAIKNLYDYRDNPEFTITLKTRLLRIAEIGVGEDYNLSTPAKDFKEFTKATKYIESTDPELVSKASLEFTSDSAVGTVKDIAEWVRKNIRYDMNYYDKVYSAKETYMARAGVCDEFANLTAAFLRIKGIPAKYVSGISFDGKRFGNHGWLKAYLKGKWYSVDSTYGEAFFLDAAHFEISEASDAEDIGGLVTRTRSSKTLERNMEISGLPLVEINSATEFSGLLGTKIITPEKIYAGNEFDINAHIKNNSGKKIMVPIELKLHPDFEYDDAGKIIILEKDEEKNINWRVKNNSHLEPSTYLTYNAFFKSPEKDEEFPLKIYYSAIQEREAKSAIELEDISPKIDYENKILLLVMTMANKGSETGSFFGTLFYDDRNLGNFEGNVEGKASLAVEERVENFIPGKYTLTFFASGKTRSYSILVPEKQEEKIIVEETTKPASENETTETAEETTSLPKAGDEKNPADGDFIEELFAENPMMLISACTIIVIAAAAAFWLIAGRRA